MAIAARARALAAGLYVTDDKAALLYVMEMKENGTVMVEDARTYDIYRMKAGALEGWRVVSPEGDRG